MKIQSLLVVSIICFFCSGVMAEEAAVVTGLCKDGTSYSGKSKRGGCRGHGGIKEWYADKAAPATTSAPAATEPAATATTTPVVKPSAAAATGICKDGSEYSGKSKRGACRGHGGVKEWFADKAPAAEVTPAPAVTAQPPEVAPALATPAATPAPAEPAPKSSIPAKVKVEAPPAGSGKVWVNTHSKIYHCEGSKFFGHTKEGEYMSETDAQAKGFVANRKKVCNK
ncbi:MAG: signal peptide protein [Methylococcaceae bacterium]|nr:signal peptide protein [Methylococcaceae bacterium]